MKSPRAPRRAPPLPKGIQIAYWAFLRKVIRHAKALVDAKLVPLLPMLMERNNPAAYADGIARAEMMAAYTQAYGWYKDALPPGKRVNHVLEAVKNQMAKQTAQKRLEEGVIHIGRLVSAYNTRQLARIGLTGTPKGTGRAVSAFTAENVSLIRSVTSDYFTDIEKQIHIAMGKGERHETLAETLKERFSVTESRAKLIARDQVLKFNGSLNAMRQQQQGISKYVWMTTEDERTREAHADFDGNVYSWDDPPGDGSAEEGTHPGTAINCRCWASPVIEEAEDL